MNFNPRAPCGARPLYPMPDLLKFRHFNPRAPCGARRGRLPGAGNLFYISIHAPRAGRDSGRRTMPPRRFRFQSTRPVRGATSRAFSRSSRVNFNPRAPCGARRRVAEEILSAESFQSTRPVRGATRDAFNGRQKCPISIHAPRAGRDCRAAGKRRNHAISIHAPRAGRDSQSKKPPCHP